MDDVDPVGDGGDAAGPVPDVGDGNKKVRTRPIEDGATAEPAGGGAADDNGVLVDGCRGGGGGGVATAAVVAVGGWRALIRG